MESLFVKFKLVCIEWRCFLKEVVCSDELKPVQNTNVQNPIGGMMMYLDSKEAENHSYSTSFFRLNTLSQKTVQGGILNNCVLDRS